MDHARKDLLTIRTGRTRPAMFDRLSADYYETPTPPQQSVTFNPPNPQAMLTTPFDRSAITAIEKVIRGADLGVSPSSDGNSIRIVISQLTEERRGEYVRLARARAESTRIVVRNVRRHPVGTLRKLKKKSEVNEDELVRAKKAMDAAAREYAEATDELPKNRRAEPSEI